MQKEEDRLFSLLKKEIVATMQKTYPAIKPDIADWKGQEITDFQEELRLKVNARISEKWFYTHLKAENRSLPRIDILNMLCRFSGYLNWDDFTFRHREDTHPGVIAGKANWYFLIIPLLVACTLALLWGIFLLLNTREYRIRLYDAETLQPINSMGIKVVMINEKESDVEYLCDSNGVVVINTDQSMLKMAIQSPYYQPDTITRIMKKFNKEEKVMLQPNDYALMLHYFTQMKVTEWEKRRHQLDSIFAEDAIIYRVYGRQKTTGIELLNKGEFIDFMTIPSSSLRQMEVLDIRSVSNRIRLLKFRINEQQP